MAESRIRLRSDLEIQAESEAAGAPVIVKDPITRRFYRFTAVQAGVLRQLDGVRSLREIAESVSQEFGIKVEEAQLSEFALKLENLLLLDTPATWSRIEMQIRAGKKRLHHLLSIKVFTFDPNRILCCLLRWFSFIFSSWFVMFALCLAFAALAITIVNWELLNISVQGLFSFSSVPLVLLVAFGVLTVHEFGHGLALKRFGGKTSEMGLLILYFFPALYCNVSDAWLLDREKRIKVTLAGGYVQLIIWSLATVAWRLAAQETFISRVCLVTIAFSGIQAIFNLIPLVRLDGYYLLSDMLGIPNLRSKSFGYVRQLMSKVLLGMGEGNPRGISRRERRIFLIYGITAFIFTGGLLWVALGRLFGWLVREFHTWGIVFAVIGCSLAIPISKGETKAPGAQPAIAPKKFPGKKLAYRLAILAILLLAALLPWELKISGDFTIIPVKKIAVNPEVDGTLKAIYVEEGTRVKPGDILAELQNLDLSNTYEETKGELAAKKADLELLLAGSRPEEIDRSKRQVETKRAELTTTIRVEQERRVLLEAVARKEAELRNAQENYERSQRLLGEGLIARNEVERDRTLFEVRQKELAEAKGQLRMLDERTDRLYQVKKKELAQAESELRILLAGSRKEQVRVMEADVRRLEEQLNILSQQVSQLKIRSSMQGIIATPYLRNRVGEYLEKGNVFCEIVSEGTVIVDMPIPEKEIADVHVGYPITLKVRGYPKRSFQAMVKSISPVAVDKDLEKKVVIQGEITDTEGILKAGMTGVGKVLCGKRMIAELATRRLIRWIRTEFWEYLP